jgi:hypothetical protein
LRCEYGEFRGEACTELLREIGHAVKVGDATTIEPVKDLTTAKGLVPALGERPFEGRTLELCEVKEP